MHMQAARSMHSDARACAVAGLLYAAFYTAFFLESLLTGDYIAPGDSLDFGVAAYLSSPSLWTQGMYSGYPIIADPQSLTWYPVLQAFRAIGVSWNAFMIAPYVIASTACFLLVRRVTGSSLSGAFSGLVYGFSGVMLGHIWHFNQIHAAAWAPLTFYGLHLIREGSYQTGTTVAAIAFALMWLAGHPQLPVYIVYTCGALVLGGLLIDRPPQPIVFRRVLWSGLAIALGCGLAAIVLVPMIELGELSRRAASTWDVYTSMQLPAWQLLALPLPLAFGGFWTSPTGHLPFVGTQGPPETTAYVGLLALSLALGAPFVRSRLRLEGRLWLVLTIVTAFLCLGGATPLGTLFFYAPGYSSFRVPARHLFVLSLCLAVGSGVTFSELTRSRTSHALAAAAIVGTMLVALSAFAVFALRTPIIASLLSGDRTYVVWALAWPLAFAAALVTCTLAVKKLARDGRTLLVAAVMLIALHVGDMVMFHYRFPGNRFEYADVTGEDIAPGPRIVALRQELRRTQERVLAADGSKNPFLLPNLTRAWDIPAASGTGSLGIERYLDVLGMGGPGDVYAETLSAAHRGLDLFSVRYALVPRSWGLGEDLLERSGRWTAVEELRYEEQDGADYILLRNDRALPRAWCVPALVRANEAEALAAIRSGHLPGGGDFDPARVALIEANVLPALTLRETANWTSEVRAAVGRQLRYFVNSTSPCLLVLGEVYYPWWRASIDSAPAATARVNHTMIGVPVSAGSHVVRLWLEPTSVWLGGAVSAGSVLACAAIVSAGRRRRRSAEAAFSRA
jgi:hypothetical protein